MTDPILNLAKRIKSIADTGLLYSSNEYDRERYTELLTISHELMGQLTGLPVEVIHNFYAPNKDYPTAKVDVRGLLLNEQGQVLLAREMADGKWTLPGGWADVGYSPAEVIAKEFLEETGLQIKATRLLAVFDKRCHPHPPQPFYVYKFALLCELTTKDQPLQKGFDILEAAYFPVDQLPALSEERILASQIALLHKKATEGDTVAYFD